MRQQVVAEFIQCDRGPGTQHREAACTLTEHLVGERHNGALCDSGVLVEQRFNVERVVFDAASINQIFKSTGDGNISNGVDLGQVSGAKPAIVREGSSVSLGVVEIAWEEQ